LTLICWEDSFLLLLFLLLILLVLFSDFFVGIFAFPVLAAVLVDVAWMKMKAF